MDPAIRRARENIGTLKAAIRKEKATARDYRDRLKTGRGGFPEDGLRNGIERCEHNVAVLKGAIVKEHENIRSMEGQQKIRDDMDRLRAGIEIPVEYADESEGD